jgi:hypothetical protein
VFAAVSSDAGSRAIPKSRIFGSPDGREHDVAGLDVAVDDPSGVRVVQGLGEPHGHSCRLGKRQAPPPGQDLVERPSLEVLQGDEEPARIVAPHVVDHDDPGM